VSWKQPKQAQLPPYGGIPSDIEVPGKTPRGKMGRDVSAGQRRIFSCVKNPVHRWPGFPESRSEWSTQAGNRDQTFVKKYLMNENPIGRQVRIAQLAEFEDAVKEPTFEIIGSWPTPKNRGLQDPPSRRLDTVPR